MQIARLWNQHGAWCREWRGEHLVMEADGLAIRLLDDTKLLVIMVLNGHSLVIEHVDEIPSEEDTL